MEGADRVVHLKRFFEEARAGRLTGIRCGRCGELAMPPKELCPSCGARAWETIPLRGEGTIASFTVIRVAPRGFTGQVPYAIAVVQLAEGPSLLGRIVDIPLDTLKLGLGVRFRPLVEDEQTLTGFGPA
jgi:uncharacterized OB-fold protein